MLSGDGEKERIPLNINENDRLRFTEESMKYKGMLLVVKDCDRALKFYHDMFGFQLLQDNVGNMELTEGLYLQETEYWERFLQKNITSRSNSTELYFEEVDIEAFVEKLERLYPKTEYVNRLMTHSWGQRVVRFYDPDGNLIEVGTPV
jgi:catechol 2,3-dioxygenase-like lactoylglutathione lyase family enzyme